MHLEFLKSENFRSRLVSSIILVVSIVASLFTADLWLFRVLFVVAGLMAFIEFLVSYFTNVQCGSPLFDDRALSAVMIAIAIGTGTIVLSLTPQEIFLVLFSAIVNDTAAYFVGSFMHNKIFKSRPFPNVSPKKSWEGTIGGYLIAVVATFFFMVGLKYFYGTDLSGSLIINIFDEPTVAKFWHRDLTRMMFSYRELAFVVLVPAFAIFGDLLESLVKRQLGQKDSNEIILRDERFKILQLFEYPMLGFGGFADRLDSWVVVACLMLTIKLC